jgi:heptosyltransferase-1
MSAPHTELRILVVRLGAMGDILHALPAVASLKRSFPASHLTWAVEPRWAPLLEENPTVDRVVGIRRENAHNLLASWRELRENSYDIALDFQGLIKSGLVAAAARPGRTLGFDRSQVREGPAALFYSQSVLTRSAHVVDRNLELAAAAGATRVMHEFPLPAGKPEGELPASDFILASPLAGWKSKQWPLEHYRELARMLRELGLALVLNLPASIALEPIEGAAVHYSGLPGLIHATRRAAGIVGVDSGPMHLAASLGKPGVALFGPTDPVRNGPYGGSLRVLRWPGAVTTYKRGAEIDESMRHLSPGEVFDALRASLHCPVQ